MKVERIKSSSATHREELFPTQYVNVSELILLNTDTELSPATGGKVSDQFTWQEKLFRSLAS